jgi:hypothetical protein
MMEVGRTYYALPYTKMVALLTWNREWAQRVRPSDGLIVKEK